jgi:hypothetical protein
LGCFFVEPLPGGARPRSENPIYPSARAELPTVGADDVIVGARSSSMGMADETDACAGSWGCRTITSIATAAAAASKATSGKDRTSARASATAISTSLSAAGAAAAVRADPAASGAVVAAIPAAAAAARGAAGGKVGDVSTRDAHAEGVAPGLAAPAVAVVDAKDAADDSCAASAVGGDAVEVPAAAARALVVGERCRAPPRRPRERGAACGCGGGCTCTASPLRLASAVAAAAGAAAGAALGAASVAGAAAPVGGRRKRTCRARGFCAVMPATSVARRPKAPKRARRARFR